ncbi:hypothetical protein FH966_02585 [Lentibacillus cibarius]|uniref:Uncharacterized protein n=1 Tax=Lentibacillus cibarius TaxID=2583219 RepID=A0A549YFM2_9BACI|nr:hypothetical protein [Lentibacillus cibarius]TRM10690.1 hypothetical protein FH966_02585 [Lentibacillus cibarius]
MELEDIQSSEDLLEKLKDMTKEEAIEELMTIYINHQKEMKKRLQEQMELFNNELKRSKDLHNEMSELKEDYEYLSEKKSRLDQKILNIAEEIVSRMEIFSDIKKELEAENGHEVAEMDLIITELKSLYDFTEHRLITAHTIKNKIKEEPTES